MPGEKRRHLKNLPKNLSRFIGWDLEGVNVKFPIIKSKKKSGRGANSLRLSPRSMDIAHWAKAIGLEGQLGAKPERRRRLDQQRCSPEGIDHWRHRRHAAINRPSLIQRNSALAVEDVEPIGTEAQFPLLSKLDRVIGAQI